MTGTAAGSKSSLDRILLALLIVLSCYYCFWNLGTRSFDRLDEHIHVRVTQEMIQKKNWFSPTLDGDPYFSKPPLKMWANAALIQIFGESVFIHRFLDGLAGCITVILVYLLARSFWLSSWCAFLAGLFLLGSRAFLFSHVVRTAVQDSALVMFSTLSIYLVWNALQKPESRKLWILAGLATGAAMMVKSVAGVFPLAVATLYMILNRKSFNLRGLVSMTLIAAAIPACYFVPLFYGSTLARDIAIEHEVIDRFKEGYHHRNAPFYYLTNLFWKGKPYLTRGITAPGWILALALGWASVGTVKNRDSRLLFLLVWIVPAVVALSLLPSRQHWYMAPIYPGIAILCAGFVYNLTKQQNLKPLYVSVVILCIASLSFKLFINAKRVNNRTRRIELDRIVEEIRQIPEQSRRVLWIDLARPLPNAGKKVKQKYRSQRLTFDEQTHLRMLWPNLSRIEGSGLEEVQNLNYTHLIAPQSIAETLRDRIQVSNEIVLKEHWQRKANWVVWEIK